VSELEPISEISATDGRHTADLTIAFPFEPKARGRDKVGAAIIGFSIFSIVVFLGAIAMMLLVEVPQ